MFVKIKPEPFGTFLFLYHSHISLQQSVNYLETLLLYQALWQQLQKKSEILEGLYLLPNLCYLHGRTLPLTNLPDDVRLKPHSQLTAS